VAVVVIVGNSPASLDGEGKLSHISSKDIAGSDEASTFDGDCRGHSRECKSSDEGESSEEEHFLEECMRVGVWCMGEAND